MFYLLKNLFFIDLLMAIGLLLFRWALASQHRGLVSGKLFLLALVTPLVALFCGNVYLFCLYLFIVVAFNSRVRSELAGVYLFLLPLTPVLTVETGVGGIYLLAVSAVAAMGLGALIGSAVTEGNHRLTLTRYDFAMWGMLILFTFMYNRYGNPSVMLRGFVTYLLAFAGPFLLVSRGPRSEVELERILLRLCLGATLVSVTALFQASRQWVLFESYYQAMHVSMNSGSASLAIRAGFLRTGGAMIDYSAGGLFLSAAVTLLPLLRRHFRLLGFTAVLVILIGGLIATQSRGSWVAAITGLLFVAVWRGQWGKLTLLVGGAGAAWVAASASGTSRLAQMVGQSEAAKGNIDYRQRLFTSGLEEISKHPLLGQTPEQLASNLSYLTQGEHIVDFVNGHLFVAMAAGIPLFLLWCWVWVMPIAEGWRQRRDRSLMSVVPAAILVPANVALAFTSTGDRNLTWSIIALGLAAPCLLLGRRGIPSTARLTLNSGSSAVFNQSSSYSAVAK